MCTKPSFPKGGEPEPLLPFKRVKVCRKEEEE
jgi:hypothetical protein